MLMLRRENGKLCISSFSQINGLMILYLSLCSHHSNGLSNLMLVAECPHTLPQLRISFDKTVCVGILFHRKSQRTSFGNIPCLNTDEGTFNRRCAAQKDVRRKLV